MNKTIEKIFDSPGKPHMVGNGFRVFNYIPGAGISQERISPFLLLDFNPEYDFGPSGKPLGVGVHPHKGFETVTISYKGSVAHHDSKGNSGVIYPGDAQWMTAGAGILHKEYHEQAFSKTGGPFEMVQLWVNLKSKDKSEEAHYQNLKAEQMGKVQVPGGGTINILAGSVGKISGPAITYTPINLFDIRLDEGSAFSFTIPITHNSGLLVIDGAIGVNGQSAEKHSFVLFNNDGEQIQITSMEKSVVLLLSGEPINEPIFSYGPFVMNSALDIEIAIKEFQAGKYGFLE